VITPVIDFALTGKELAPNKIASFGYSLADIWSPALPRSTTGPPPSFSTTAF
jgi:hypothetical protein